MWSIVTTKKKKKKATEKYKLESVLHWNFFSQGHCHASPNRVFTLKFKYTCLEASPACCWADQGGESQWGVEHLATPAEIPKLVPPTCAWATSRPETIWMPHSSSVAFIFWTALSSNRIFFYFFFFQNCFSLVYCALSSYFSAAIGVIIFL